MPFRLGCVPYVNARPLVALFEAEPSLGVEVVYDVPSRLPRLLRSGEADAVLVSSHFALSTDGARAAAGTGICSDGPVESVRLFSKVHPKNVRSLALDASSMTSNALALSWLRERHGASPASEPCPHDLAAMLAGHDAAVLIGDNGMRPGLKAAHVFDLGQEWTAWTGLPFVWALWVGFDGLSPRLAGLLDQARDWSGLGRGATATDRSDRVVQDAAAESGLDPSPVRAYLEQTMVFRVGERERQGLRRFAALTGGQEPRWVEAERPVGV
jgi:chorismate dehydratase